MTTRAPTDAARVRSQDTDAAMQLSAMARAAPALLLVLLVGLMVFAALGGCAASARPPSPLNPLQESGVEVTVMRDGDRWTADYVLDRDALAWAFLRSGLTTTDRQSWRLRQWRVETPGVVLERQGDRDILRAVDGGPVPRRVRIAMRPAATDLEFDYSPALVFSDGAVALYSEHFDVIALAPRDPARMTARELAAPGAPRDPAKVRWRDAAGPVLLNGRRLEAPTTRQARTYVLFGQARQREGARMTTVIDPALPGWIGDELSAFAPRVADLYEDRLGPGQTDRPTVMVSWSGPTSGATSMNGSVLPGLIVMSFDGAGILQPTEEMRTISRWFIAHESAHFWLGQKVRYETADQAWITEGGADLMAVRAIQAIDPTYDARGELQRSLDDCAALSRGRAIGTAGERGEHRAYYACGAVFAMVAEAAQKQGDGGDWFDFLRPLLHQPDGVLSRREWLSALTRASRDPSLRLDIERLLDEPVADPAAVISRLFDRTGLPHDYVQGRVVLH